MAFKIKRSIPLLVVGDPKDPKDPKTAKPVGIKSVKTTTPTPKISKAKPTVSKKVTPKPTTVTKQRTHAQILKAYPGAKKVEGKINTYKYKGATLNPALFPVENKAKTVKQAIDIKEKK